MRMVQWKCSCEFYLLSYVHFYLPNLPSKMSLKKCSYRNNWNAAATVTSLKVIWNEGPDQARQGKGLSSRDYAAYTT